MKGIAGKIIVTAAALILTAGVAQAQQPNARRAQFDKDVVGKSIVMVPIGMIPLVQVWNSALKKDTKALGIKYSVRDPNLNPAREVQIIKSLIPQHPDVLLVHNPNRSVLANVLKEANKAGIYVIQINMASNTRTDAFVGADPVAIGRALGEAAVKACTAPGARSNKIAIMAGEPTSTFNLGIQKGESAVYKKHAGEVNIVSKQFANHWSSQIAHDKAATVLQAHPDLCAYVGEAVNEDTGTAQAVAQAGLKGKVKVITSNGGIPVGCRYVKKGLIYKMFNYDSREQAAEMLAISKFLLQSGKPAGTFHIVSYTPLIAVTKANLTSQTCAALPSNK